MLQRIIHAIVYAAIRAYFDAVRDAKLYQEEVVTDVDRRRAAAFRTAVDRVRESDADPSNPQPACTTPDCESCTARDLCPHSQWHDETDGTGPRRVVGGESDGGRGIV